MNINRNVRPTIKLAIKRRRNIEIQYSVNRVEVTDASHSCTVRPYHVENRQRPVSQFKNISISLGALIDILDELIVE